MKKQIVIFVWIFFAASLLAQVNSTDLYKKYYNEGNYREAINTIAKTDTLKRSGEEWFYLAQSYYANKEILPAVTAYKRAVELNPTHNGFRINHARALSASGNNKDAIFNFSEIVKSDSSNQAALSELGQLYINTKKYELAKNAFDKILSQNESDFLSYYFAAISTFSIPAYASDSTTIPNYLIWCLISNPRYLPAREFLGNYYFAKGKFKRALTEYESMTYYTDDNAEVHFKIGMCLEKLERFQAAIPSYEKAVVLDSTNANYYSHLGYCNYMKNEYNAAVSAYKKAALLDKDNPTTFQNLGMSYLKLDSLDAAKKAFNTALGNFGFMQMTFIINQIAFINLKQKKYEEAREVCEKVLALEPENVFALFNLARAYDELKKYSNAVKIYKKALPLMKDIPSMQGEIKFTTERIKELEKVRG